MRLNNWQEIHDDIQKRIINRELQPGEKLPKDVDLAEEYGCARTTVQRAMRKLAETGTVDRRRRGGTHVSRDPVTRAHLEIPITRLEIEKRGLSYGYLLVSAEMKKLTPQLVARFELSETCSMLNVRAVHLADKRPYIYEDRWISTQTVPEIHTIDLSTQSANEWLIRNRPYSRCDLRIFATKADIIEVEMLETPIDEALLVIERTTWIENNPITSVRAVGAPNYQIMARI